MIILNDRVLWACLSPVKANPPLTVDPYTVLTFSVPFQSLKPIPRRNSQGIQGGCSVQELKLAISNSMNPWIKLWSRFAQPHKLRVAVTK